MSNKKEKAKCSNEELVDKTSYIHPNMLLICIIDFLLQLKYVPIVGYFHLT